MTKCQCAIMIITEGKYTGERCVIESKQTTDHFTKTLVWF